MIELLAAKHLHVPTSQVGICNIEGSIKLPA